MLRQHTSGRSHRRLEMGVEPRAETTLPGTTGLPTAEDCRGSAGSALRALVTKRMGGMAEDMGIWGRQGSQVGPRPQRGAGKQS